VSVLKKLASQSAWYGLSSIIGRALFFLLTPFYTRTFVDVQSFGLMSYVYAYIAFANVLYSYGLETGFFFFSQRYQRQKVYGTAMSSILISTTLLTLLIIVFYQPIVQLMRLQMHPEFVWYAAAILALEVLSVIPFGLLRMQQKPRKFALIKLAGIVINIGLNLFFLWFCPLAIQNQWLGIGLIESFYNPNIGVGYVFISNIISSGAILILLHAEIRQCKWQLDTQLLKQMLTYALPLLVAGLAGMINETIDRIILSYLITDTNEAMRQQGIYGAVYKLAMLMTMFVQAFRFAAEPYFFARQKDADVKQVYAYVVRYFVLGSALVFLIVMLYIDVFKYFIGSDSKNEYWEGLHVVPVLLLANLCLGVYLNISMWYKWSGQTKYGAWFSVGGALITLALNFLLIPKYGYTGCAYTTLICYGSMLLVSYIIGAKKYPVYYDLKSMLTYVIAAIALYACSLWFDNYAQPGLPLLLTFNSMLLSIYVAAIWYSERSKKI